MNVNYIILILICLSAVAVLLADIVVANRVKYVGLRWILTGLFTFSMLRYFTLIAYGDSPSLGQLESLRYFYLATSIGLTIPTALAVWYISPQLREKVNYIVYLLFFIPWIAFYLYVIITQPTQIAIAPEFGYDLLLVAPFGEYLSVVQGSFVAVIVLLCLIGIIMYKHPLLRSQFVFLIIAQIGLTIDGLSIANGVTTRLFHPFTITEIIGFIAIYYAFLYKPMDTKKN